MSIRRTDVSYVEEYSLVEEILVYIAGVLMETIWTIYLYGAGTMLLIKVISLFMVRFNSRTKSEYLKRVSRNPGYTATIFGVLVDIALWPLIVCLWLSKIKLV